MIMELMDVNVKAGEITLSAREVHEFLEVKTGFRHWFLRMCDYGFREGVDFNLVKFDQVQFEGGRRVKRISNDYEITISMAKELCMLQRTKRGKLAREYFIEIEMAFNTPDMVMARAVQIADCRIKGLRFENNRLAVENAELVPKGEYFDVLVDKNLLTNLRDTAKELGVSQTSFVDYLVEKKYLYRDGRNMLKPYAYKNRGLFELKEFMNRKTGFVGTQVFVTPKGRERFLSVFLGSLDGGGGYEC